MSGENSGAAAEEKLLVGKVTGVYGVKGWIKVYSWTEPRENITRYQPWYIKKASDSDWQQLSLESGRRHGKTVIAKIEGIDDRNEAMLLTGMDIAIDASRLEPLGEDEFYWRELIGLRVITPQGDCLGEVQEMMETGANDVLVIRGEQGPLYLVPWALDDTVLAVDLLFVLISRFKLV